MSGVPDPLYVAARTTLLDALEAIGRHREAVVLVGAQAVYVRAGTSELAVAAYTTDADLAIDPASLGPEPLLEEMLGIAGFSRSSQDVGVWSKDVPVEGVPRRIVVDLLVPETLGGPGRRGARIPPHGKLTARKVIGLEGALVDRDLHTIGALDFKRLPSIRGERRGPRRHARRQGLQDLGAHRRDGSAERQGRSRRPAPASGHTQLRHGAARGRVARQSREPVCNSRGTRAPSRAVRKSNRNRFSHGRQGCPRLGARRDDRRFRRSTYTGSSRGPRVVTDYIALEAHEATRRFILPRV